MEVGLELKEMNFLLGSLCNSQYERFVVSPIEFLLSSFKTIIMIKLKTQYLNPYEESKFGLFLVNNSIKSVHLKFTSILSGALDYLYRHLYSFCNFLFFFVETRDATFKPVPVVQKPISSVLEKIRQRKLEVLKK